jgi:hypothetical protein
MDAVSVNINVERVFYENMTDIESTVELHRIATVPVSGLVLYAGYDVPEGFFQANAAEILIDGYRDLYNKLTNFGTTFPFGANTNGSGAPGTTHFRLPNPTAPANFKYVIKY